MEQNDPKIDISKKDISFCIHVMLQILMTIKHEPALFSDTIDSSEWDYIVKFWGPITQRLFYFSGLRLKWGDTHLTLHDTIGYIVLKVDLRIIHDSMKQRCNVENEVGVAEAAEENPGKLKFNSDHSKVLIESKAMVDRFVLDSCKYVVWRFISVFQNIPTKDPYEVKASYILIVLLMESDTDIKSIGYRDSLSTQFFFLIMK